MSLKKEQIFNLIQDIRYADIIIVLDNIPYSMKATTCLKLTNSCIEFHIPKRYRQIIEGINMSDKILIKYSTEYAEVSSEWCLDAPKEKRISTIIGIEIHIRGEVKKLNQEDLIIHLRDTTTQNKERIQDNFTIDQLDKNYFEEALNQIDGYRMKIVRADIQTIENIVDYRTERDKVEIVQRLRALGDCSTNNKFLTASKLVETT